MTNGTVEHLESDGIKEMALRIQEGADKWDGYVRGIQKQTAYLLSTWEGEGAPD